MMNVIPLKQKIIFKSDGWNGFWQAVQTEGNLDVNTYLPFFFLILLNFKKRKLIFKKSTLLRTILLKQSRSPVRGRRQHRFFAEE